MKENMSITELLRDLYLTTGFRFSIRDVNYNLIAGYPKDGSEFCNCLHKSKEAYNMCSREDFNRFNEVKKRNETIIYKCKFGLYEAISPIYNYNVLSGYLLMGQVAKKEDFSKEEMLAKVKPYFKENIDEIKEKIEHIPIVDGDAITSSVNIMTVCANFLTLTNKVKTVSDNLARLTHGYLYENYKDKISIEEMCKKFNCCKSTLINSFKKTYHTTIIQKLTEIRIEEAKKLLDNTNLSISEISQMTGFSDQSYFSKTFKEYHGISPREYKNNVQEIND
jgi:AraC-like DNA-binding protein